LIGICATHLEGGEPTLSSIMGAIIRRGNFFG
jgi:hypothetical protein